MPKIMFNGIEYTANVPYKELQGILTAGQTSITFNDNVITTGRNIDYFISDFTVAPIDIVIAEGSMTLSFNAQVKNIIVKVRIS